MLPENWDTWARAFRKRPLWEPGASTAHVSIGRTEIEQLIPHRAPFLLLDEIDAVDLRQSAARARRVIETDDAVFRGHFPGDPIYPGVLQLEMVGQLGVWLSQRLQSEQGVSFRAIKIHHAVFTVPVLPGEAVDVRAQILADDGTTTTVAGQVSGAAGIASIAAMELCRVG